MRLQQLSECIDLAWCLFINFQHRFLYMLFLCMGANFHLKNQIVSNYSQDPGLGTGWAYMAPCEEYEQYMLSRMNDGDVCSISTYLSSNWL